jgi:hypothetical protein
VNYVLTLPLPEWLDWQLPTTLLMASTGAAYVVWVCTNRVLKKPGSDREDLASILRLAADGKLRKLYVRLTDRTLDRVDCS